MKVSTFDPKAEVWNETELPEGRRPVHVLMVTGGYVESATNASLILWSPIGYATVEDALEMAGTAFKVGVQVYADENHASQTRHGAKCPHCNKLLETGEPKEIADVELAEAIYEYITGMCDGSHEIWESLGDHGWNQGLIDARDPTLLADPVLIFEYGDWILADVALGGRTVVEKDATGFDYRYDWDKHMRVPDGVQLYRG